MKLNKLPMFYLCWIAVIQLAAVHFSFAQKTVQSLPFQDPTLPIDVRVNDLVSRMTLEEKISQMQHTAPTIGRLGIPAYNWWNECLHGVARNGIATVFPQAIAMAATFNPGLIGQEADVISTEARAKYTEAISKNEHGIYQGLTFWSPNINIFRDPRWGRGQETYGEDPFLTSEIGKAFVKGLQGSDPKYFKVVATAKHFAVHSGPESERHRFDAWPTLPDFFNTYLPAFEALVREAKVYSVMSCYNRVYGTPASANQLLLSDLLRTKWGFKGYVVSDCWAISDFYNFHKFVPTAEQATSLAVRTGCDLACGNEYDHLGSSVKLGLLSEADINTSVKRLFEARFRLGMFDPPAMVPYSVIKATDYNTPENSRLAREVSRQGMVLLKNDNNVLPISKKIKSVAVIGPYANDTAVLLGNYNGIPSSPVTLLQGIMNRVGKNLKSVKFEIGAAKPEDVAKSGNGNINFDQQQQQALKVAAKADLIIFCGGISPNLEGEEMDVKVEGFKGGDRTNLEIPANQTELLRKLKNLNKPVVLVITNGSALSVVKVDPFADAIVETWYPGQEGGNALADILFGDYNPAGRLPVTFYNSVSDLPAFEDYSMKGRTYRYFEGAPYYPFGFGMSYSSFQYSDLSVSLTSDSLFVFFKIRNTSKRDGDEVPQVYIRHPESLIDRPLSTLVGFDRRPIPAGADQKFMIRIPFSRLRYYSIIKGDYEIPKGAYELHVGSSSKSIMLKSGFIIE